MPYGPWLWMPYVIPHTLGVDPRILTLTAFLVVPGACVWAAVLCVQDGRFAVACLFMSLAMALCMHPKILQFYRIGHTLVYVAAVGRVLLARAKWTVDKRLRSRGVARTRSHHDARDPSSTFSCTCSIDTS